jgi:RNA polymerase sigma-70 factor (ECF subfamily)
MEHSEKTKYTILVNAETFTNTGDVTDFSVPAALPKTGYHESHEKIKNMIDMLPGVQREVIVLNNYGGLSFKEIADIMKCSLNTALDTMRFGLNNLQKLMTEKEIVIR